MVIVKHAPTILFGTTQWQILENVKVHNKHHRTAPADAVYIGRGSPWGNPFVIGKDGTRAEVIEKFRQAILPELVRTGAIEMLRGKHLVCFCKPQACHGDLLLEAANQ